MADDKAVEALARKMCTAHNLDPDLTVFAIGMLPIVGTPIGDLPVISEQFLMPLWRAWRRVAEIAIDDFTEGKAAPDGGR